MLVWVTDRGRLRYPPPYPKKALSLMRNKVPGVKDVGIVVDETTRPLAEEMGFDWIWPAEPSLQGRGWWAKVELFNVQAKHRLFYLDLDLVAVKRLDHIATQAEQAHGLIASEDFIGWKGIKFNSSVMSWNGEDYRDLYRPDLQPKHPAGDQGWTWDQLRQMRRSDEVSFFNNRWIASFRAAGGRPRTPDTELVNFHGRPKPHEVNLAWVREAWR